MEAIEDYGEQPIPTQLEMAEHVIARYGRDFYRSSDGYDDAELDASEGWHALASWGCDGWDIGDWPFMVYSVRQNAGAYELLERCEGDAMVWRFDTRAELYAAVDRVFLQRIAYQEIAAFTDAGIVPSKDVAGTWVPERFRGPYRKVTA